MKTKKIILIFSLIAVISLSFIALERAKAAGVTDVEKLKQTIPQLRVPIPELGPFQEPTTVERGDKTFIVIPWIAQYISAIYRYSLGIAAVAAVVAVMIGGILYLTSAGYPQRIDQGKNIIIGAITGLVIIIFSYLFLNFINPELVKLRPIAIESIRQELLTVGEYCDELPATDVQVIVGGQPISPSNTSSFQCGMTYKVQASANSAYTVSEGQTCLGRYCQGDKSCVNKQCITGIIFFHIRGGQLLTLGRDIDWIQLKGISKSDKNVVIDITGELDTEGETEYILQDSAELKQNLAKVKDIFLYMQFNDYDIFETYTYHRYVQADLAAFIGQIVGGALTPTGDDNMYGVKHYSKPDQAIWGTPVDARIGAGDAVCPTCTVLEPNDDDGRFGPRKPWCKFWTVDEITQAQNTGKPLDIYIDVSQFPEDFQDPRSIPSGLNYSVKKNNPTQYQTNLQNFKNEDLEDYPVMLCASGSPKDAGEAGCTSPDPVCQADTKAMPSLPGTPCPPGTAAGYSQGNLMCRHASYTDSSKLEWVDIQGSGEGELCDNCGEKTTVEWPGIMHEPFCPPSGSQTCTNGTVCNYDCIDNEICEGSLGSIIPWCIGRCGKTKVSQESKPGSSCLCGGNCKSYQGQKMYCNNISMCTFGTWGDPCTDDKHCAGEKGFKCLEYASNPKIQFCGKDSNLGAFQACTDTSQCQSGLTCRLLHYADEDEGDKLRCNEWAVLDDVDPVKVCIQDSYMTDALGVCDCETNDHCYIISSTTGNNPVSYWPGLQGGEINAGFCTKMNDPYCSPVVEGGWCNPAQVNPLPQDQQAQFNCQALPMGGGGIVASLFQGYGVIREKDKIIDY